MATYDNKAALGSNLFTIIKSVLTKVKSAYDLANSKYSLPSTGIPKSDLASAVQTSLNKADTAVQQADISGKAEVFTAIVTSTSWSDVAAAFNAGKVLFAYIGGTVSGGSSVFRQSVPLSYVVYESDGTTPGAFIFLFENSTPKTASGSGVGSTTRWTVSSTGWSSSLLNVDYAKAANTANSANTATTLSSTLPIGLGGTGATSATAAEYNLLTKTTTQLSAVSGSDRILFAFASPSASNGRIGGYRTVDTVGAYILTLMSSYRKYAGIGFMQQICYAPTSPGTGKGNVHMFAGGKWHNLVNISENDAGNVKIASMPSDVTSWTDVLNPPSSMFVAKGLCITRQGYVGTLHGFIVPNPNTEDYLPTRSSNTATTYTQSGYKAAACTHLRIDGFDENIVGGGMAIFTGGLILYVQVSSGTLQAVTTSSFGNFTAGSEYFFSIPISFSSIK